MHSRTAKIMKNARLALNATVEDNNISNIKSNSLALTNLENDNGNEIYEFEVQEAPTETVKDVLNLDNVTYIFSESETKNYNTIAEEVLQDPITFVDSENFISLDLHNGSNLSGPLHLQDYGVLKDQEDINLPKHLEDISFPDMVGSREQPSEQLMEILETANFQRKPMIQEYLDKENANIIQDIDASKILDSPKRRELPREELMEILETTEYQQEIAAEKQDNNKSKEENYIEINVDDNRPQEPDYENLKDQEIAQNLKKRRRFADPDTWDKNKTTNLRMFGKEYTGYRRAENTVKHNVKRPGRKIKPACISKFCARTSNRFCQNISQAERNDIFVKFWDMSWEQKRMFFAHMLIYNEKKRSYVNGPSRRTGTYDYFLKVKTGKKQVCKTMFLNTLGVGEKMVQNWISAAQKDGLMENTQRRHQNVVKKRNSTPRAKEDISRKTNLRQFLESLPKLESHYCRKHTGKLYLENDFKSKTEVYNLYKEHCHGKEVPLSSCKFSNEFESMNLALFKPRKDQCDMCCSYKMKQITEAEYTSHIRAKDLARIQKETDKIKAINKEIYCFTVDVQAVKLSPVLQASSLYFKTKLQVHNFTIYNLESHRSMNCIWNETEGDLDSSVFTTCLIRHLEDYLNSEKKQIVIFSDGCGYQNRNVVLANALSFLASKYDVDIEQKFLERGHTQMECDSTHSLIERKLKNRQIYLPTDYISVIKESRKNPTPLDVSYLTHNFFLNYNEPKKFRYNSIRPEKLRGDLKVTDLRALKYLPNSEILFKVGHDQEYELLPQRKNDVNPNFERNRLYLSRLKISKKKWKDLQQLKSVLPNDVHFFYDMIPYEDDMKSIEVDPDENPDSNLAASTTKKSKKNIKKKTNK